MSSQPSNSSIIITQDENEKFSFQDPQIPGKLSKTHNKNKKSRAFGKELSNVNKDIESQGDQNTQYNKPNMNKTCSIINSNSIVVEKPFAPLQQIENYPLCNGNKKGDTAETQKASKKRILPPKKKRNLVQFPQELDDSTITEEYSSPQDQQKTKPSFQHLASHQKRQILLNAKPQIEDCDIFDKDDPQAVSEYASAIFYYLRSIERITQPSQDYILKQKDINEKMRAILIDWLVDVHYKFQLREKVLYLAVNIIDRFLEKQQISRQRLQLVGITSMLIASKFEEIYPPEVKEFVFVTDNAYRRELILEFEGEIIKALNFNLSNVTAYEFLQRYAKVHQVNDITFFLAQYLMELSLIEAKMLKYLPSNIAASALYLACKINKCEGWSDSLTRSAKYTEAQVRPCSKDMCILLQNVSRSQLQAVRKKFGRNEFLKVAQIQLQSCQQRPSLMKIQGEE